MDSLPERPKKPLNLLEESGQELYKVPVFLSYATPFNDLQTFFLERVLMIMRANLLFPRTLIRTDQFTEPPITSVRRMVLSSYGLMAIAFRRVYIPEAISRPGTSRQEEFEDFWLSSPYLQIEPSMAYQQGLPLLILVEEGVSTNATFGGILEQGAAPFLIIHFRLEDEQQINTFFRSATWREAFADWNGQVRSGYAIQTEPTFKYTCNRENKSPGAD